MSNIRFACTSLAGTDKKGVLTPDENGYYTMPIGGLDVFNSAGMFYTYKGAKELFEESSAFMRRVKRGALRGEVGHPKLVPGMSMDDYAQRIIVIDERNVCAHFAEIWLDFDKFKDTNGKPCVAIMAKVGPSGPHGPMLKKAFDNPNENVCFSIRSFTEDYWVKGVKFRDLRTIVTFDYVNEPGIHFAEKYKSPSLESIAETVITEGQIRRATERATLAFGQESAILSRDELFNAFGWTEKPAPGYMKW